MEPTLVKVLWLEPVVTNFQEKPDLVEHSDADRPQNFVRVIQEQTETSSGVYKLIEFDKADCAKVKQVAV
jgi:hypothetical protein